MGLQAIDTTNMLFLTTCMSPKVLIQSCPYLAPVVATDLMQAVISLIFRIKDRFKFLNLGK